MWFRMASCDWPKRCHYHSKGTLYRGTLRCIQIMCPLVAMYCTSSLPLIRNMLQPGTYLSWSPPCSGNSSEFKICSRQSKSEKQVPELLPFLLALSLARARLGVTHAMLSQSYVDMPFSPSRFFSINTHWWYPSFPFHKGGLPWLNRSREE